MDKKKLLLLAVIAIPGLAALAYLSGLLAQLLANYALWQELGGMNSPEPIQAPSLDPGVCFPALLSIHGLKSVLLILGILSAIILYIRFHDRFGSGSEDPRGFDTSKSGIYGTASWMTESEMREILEINPIDKAEGTILGEYRGKAVCMPKDTRLNRHIAIFGASGTMKSRAIIRNALFQDIKRGESVIITDSKGELYADTSELFRKNGYDVKVFNLVNPEHGDSWNCMADLNGDTLMAQILTNVIIGNTSSGKGDHFWDGGEGNLLKALILYVDQDPTRDPEEKHLSAAYRLLTQNTEQQLTAIFDRLPLSHPARPPYSLFAQASETVKSGIIIGLGTRLQVLQNEAVQRITSQSDIDLKLTRYADSRPSGACDVPVNLILDEFNNIGRIGGAADGSDFARTLSVIRSRDIRVMLAIQSLGQLQNRYANNLWAEIIGNCDIQLMLGCTDGVTAEYFSARSGDMSVLIKSTMTVRQTMAVAQMIPQYRQTEGQGRRRLLTPDEVLRLPNTDLLCVIRGCNMLRLKKLDYTGHRMSKHVPRKPELPQQPSMPSSDAALPEQSGSDGEKKAKKKREKLYSSSKPPQNF